MTYDVVVIGAGPAGILAASRAAARGRKVLLLEKNARPGVKVLISGGTRCNVTNASPAREICAAFGPGGRFLGHALRLLDPAGVVELLEREGVPTKVEPEGKVFPVSDKAKDVLAAFLAVLARSGAGLALSEPVVEVTSVGDGFIVRTARREIVSPRCVLAVGGKSYPKTGTTGDGYAIARALGHTVVPPVPALVPLICDAPWVHALRGVAVPDARVRALAGEEVVAERRRALLFTHFGLSGPGPLDISRPFAQGRSDAAAIDFLPDLSAAELGARIDAAGRTVRRILDLGPFGLPARLWEAIVATAGVPPLSATANASRAARERLVGALKETRLPVRGTLGFDRAEVTAGGVALEEVDPRTMESRVRPGLFLAGEILDLDGPIGGYNFQAAFATGALAGENV